MKVPVKVPYRRRRPGAESPAVRHRLAWRDMEWQMLRILLIFRLMHGIQLAVTVPGIAGHTRHPGRALTLLLAVLAESLWFVLHIFRNHRRVLARDAGGEPDAARSAGTAEDAAAGQGAPGWGRRGTGPRCTTPPRRRSNWAPPWSSYGPAPWSWGRTGPRTWPRCWC
ncbi:hypothetical protein SAZ11_23385 [Streptomyces sp. FXJ1.4098]|nr:hypothetical protein [Streptomyces sp. FXJ1.4098]